MLYHNIPFSFSLVSQTYSFFFFFKLTQQYDLFYQPVYEQTVVRQLT